MSGDLMVVSASAARGFLLVKCALGGADRPRLPRAGKRLMVNVDLGAGALESWIVERRPGTPATYSIVRVRNVAIDAVTPA